MVFRSLFWLWSTWMKFCSPNHMLGLKNKIFVIKFLLWKMFRTKTVNLIIRSQWQLRRVVLSLQLSVFSFAISIKSKTRVSNVPVIKDILAIAKIQSSDLYLKKLYSSPFSKASSGIYSESLNGMPLILTLLKNKLPTLFLCENFA